MTLEEKLEGLVGVRYPLPRKGRLMMWLKRSVMEQGVRREKERRLSPERERMWKVMVELPCDQ